MENKKLVVINGKGLSGKDTFVGISSFISEWPVYNFSSVAIVKKAAEILGWENTKEPEDRKFLSDLKQLSINYNNQPNEYLVYSATEMPNYSLGFFHIRESKEIDVFKSSFTKGINIVTLLVNRHKNIYGNISDDEVDLYNYDYVIDNNGDEISLLIKTREFLEFIGVPVDENRYIEMCNSGSWDVRSSLVSDGCCNFQRK